MGIGGSHVTPSRNAATVPAGQVVVTGGEHGLAPHGPPTSRVGAAGGGEADGSGMTTGAEGGSYAGLRAVATSTGGARTTICGSVEMTRLPGADRDPAVDAGGFIEQAADPKQTATTEPKCLNPIAFSPFGVRQ